MSGPAETPPADDGVVRVAAAADVGRHIREAAGAGHGLVPRSSVGRGRHGRGAARPGTRLLDLSGLRQVLLVDPRQRVAIVEAGVTYGDLQPRLEAEGLRLCHPLLPPAGKSVVASQMDREPQMVPKYHWDFTDPMLCAELWLGTGDRFRTGSAAGPGATLEDQWRAGMFQKNPLGPAQTDIAKLAQGAQGALGFATWVSLRVERVPELRRHLRVVADDLAPIAGLVAGVTRRRLGDEVLVFDRHQVRRLADGVGVEVDEPAGRWTLLMTVGSLPRRAERSLEVQLVELGELARAAGVTLQHIDGEPAEGFLRAVTGLPAPGPDAGDWKRRPTGASRELSFLTTLDRAEPLVTHVRRAWEPLVGEEMVGAYLQPVNQGRTCHVELTAFPTPATADAIDDGVSRLVDELIDAGAFFSRPIGPAVEPAYRRCPDVVRTLHKVKAVLDPDQVLSPGALCFEAAVAALAHQEGRT